MMHDDLIILSKKMSQYVVGAEGNISKKIENGLVIKASGAKLKYLKKSDLVTYDFNGNQLDNFHKKGSMELGFHTYLINKYNVKYISHTHPSNTLKILISDESFNFANLRFFPDQVVFNGSKSCVVPYKKPGNDLTEAIKESVDKFIDIENFFPKLILLENHGIIACGDSVNECIVITEICEKSAEIFLTPYKKKPLSSKEIKDLILDKEEIYRKKIIA